MISRNTKPALQLQMQLSGTPKQNRVFTTKTPLKSRLPFVSDNLRIRLGSLTIETKSNEINFFKGVRNVFKGWVTCELCVIWDKSLNLSSLQFPYFKGADTDF